MAVTEWNVLADGTWGPRIDTLGARTYQRTIEAFTNDANEGGLSVLSQIPITKFVTAWPTDPFALAVEVDCKQDEDLATYWILRYGYTTKLPELAQANLQTGGGGGGQPSPTHNPDEPLSWAPVCRWSTRMFKRIRFRDRDGQLYANKAGEMLELGMQEYPRLVLNVTRNVPWFDERFLVRVMNGVNITPVIGYEPRRVKCEKLTAEIKKDKQLYWELNGEFLFGAGDSVGQGDLDLPGCPADGWFFEKRLNAGYSYWNSVTNKLVSILDENGQRPSRPALLNSTGTARIFLNTTPPGTPNFLFFRELEDVDMLLTGIFNP